MGLLDKLNQMYGAPPAPGTGSTSLLDRLQAQFGDPTNPSAQPDDEWERRGNLLVNKRTGERKPATLAPIEGGLPTERMHISPDTNLVSSIAEGAKGAARSIGAGVVDSAEQMAKVTLPGIAYQAAHGRLPLQEGAGPLADVERATREMRETGSTQMRSAARGMGLPGVVGEGAAGVSYLAGGLADPVAVGGTIAARTGAKVAKKVAEEAAPVIPKIARTVLDDAARGASENVAEVTARELIDSGADRAASAMSREVERASLPPRVHPIEVTPGPALPNGQPAPYSSFVFPIEANGKRVGQITGYINDGAKQVIVDETMLDDIARGKGLGRQGYEDLYDWAAQNNMHLASDHIVSEDAAHVYEALKKRGYRVEVAPDAEFNADFRSFATDNAGTPVFKVTGGPNSVVEGSDGVERILAARRSVESPEPIVPPRPHISEPVITAYEGERAAIDAEFEQLAASGNIPPNELEAARTTRIREFEADWHARLAEATKTADEDALHSLADATEDATIEPIQGAPAAIDTRPGAAPVQGMVPSSGGAGGGGMSGPVGGGIGPVGGGGGPLGPGGTPVNPIPGTGGPGGPNGSNANIVAHGWQPGASVIQYGPVKDNRTLLEKLRAWSDRWVDQMSDKEDAPVRLLRRAGLSDAADHVSKLISRARGSAAIARLPIFRGVYKYDPVTRNTARIADSLQSVLGGLDATAERDLNNLMAAEHHMELFARHAAGEKKLAIDQRGTMEAQRIFADLRKRYGSAPNGRVAKLADVADRVREWSRLAVVEQLDSVGYFKPGQKAEMLRRNERYSGMFRMLDDIAKNPEFGDTLTAGVSGGRPLHGISGGLNPDNKIAPPLESFIAQAQRVNRWVERQRVRNTIADYAEAFSSTIGKEIKRVKVPSPNSAAGFTAYRNGARLTYTAPAEVMKALETMSPKQLPLMLSFLEAGARTIRAGATATLDFAVRNFLRDQTQAGVYGVEYGYRPFADFLQGLRAQLPGAGKLADFVAQWEASGGAMSDIISANRPEIQATLREVTAKRPALARTFHAWKSEKNPFVKYVLFPVLHPMEEASAVAEKATRIGAFRRAKLNGATDLEAAHFSRNVTLDFGRSGSFGQRWNSVEAFANAQLQDVARFSQAMKKNPVATGASAMAYVTLPALAMYAKNRSDPAYRALPEWEKATFLHLAKLDDGRWVRMPRPQGLINLAFGYGWQKALEAADKAGLSGAVDEMLGAVLEETPLKFLPVTKDPRGGFTPGSFDWLPSAVQPLTEIAAGPQGYSQFRQGPIVPSALAEGQLPADQYLDTTSATARSIGRAVGVAPMKVDYLIRNYGGGLATSMINWAERGVNAVGSAMGAENVTGGGAGLPQLPAAPKDIPGIGGLVSTSPYGFASQPVQDLYDLEAGARQAKGSLDDAIENNRVLDYQRIMRQHPEAMIADRLGDVRRQLADLRAIRKQVRSQPGMTPEDRADALLQIDQMVTTLSAATMHESSDYLRGMRGSSK